jgi:hypothetical protein
MSSETIPRERNKLGLRPSKYGLQPIPSLPDWLEHLIEIARFAATAAELAPFPYVKDAAGVVVMLLETIKVRSIALQALFFPLLTSIKESSQE